MLKKIRFAVMKKIILLSAIGSFIGLLNSCSTDFDIIAPYKEVIVVNGLINPLDSVHYVHVGKIFLGEGDVYTMAQQADSVNYADILDVKMERLVSKNVVETFILDRTTEIAKDSGVFAYPFQVMYKTTHPILMDGSEYRLVVTNRETGVTATSTTKILKDLTVTSPSPLLNDTVDWATAPDNPYFVNYTPSNPATSVFLHDMIIRLHYREIDPSGVSNDNSFDWHFNAQSPGTNPIKFRLYKNDFFKACGDNIPVRPGYTIRLDTLENGRFPIEIICIEAPEDLVTYYQLQNSQPGIVLDKPNFSTVENGLGLFSNRLMHSEFLFPDQETQAAFDTSIYTRDLNFEF